MFNVSTLHRQKIAENGLDSSVACLAHFSLISLSAIFRLFSRKKFPVEREIIVERDRDAASYRVSLAFETSMISSKRA